MEFFLEEGFCMLSVSANNEVSMQFIIINPSEVAIRIT